MTTVIPGVATWTNQNTNTTNFTNGTGTMKPIELSTGINTHISPYEYESQINLHEVILNSSYSPKLHS